MKTISFKPKQITKKLLTVLPPRARDVLEKRYGLDPKDSTSQTLEAIGQTYGITRERVRQIENYSIQSIQKSDVYKEYEQLFAELAQVVEDLGGIIAEQDLLAALASDQSTRNHIFFLLVLGTPFSRNKEDNSFHHRWYVKDSLAQAVEKALLEVQESLSEEELISESEMINRFISKLSKIEERYKQEEYVKRWLGLSKAIGQNPLGEWGISTSPNVRAKGIRDFAYLAVKRHGSPMHFREVAEAIESLFNRKAHVATCHNELIKDSRFVLVGRGLYALTEWGYSAGVVKDVLRTILKENGPLTREEIIDRVRKERYVKDNTIIVNLQDTSLFTRLPDGHYTLAK
jgi:hypothetical protein